MLAAAKCGLMSAPRLPQALQTKRGSMSDNRTSLPHWSADMGNGMATAIVSAIDEDAYRAAGAHLAKRDLLGARGEGRHGPIIAPHRVARKAAGVVDWGGKKPDWIGPPVGQSGKFRKNFNHAPSAN